MTVLLALLLSAFLCRCPRGGPGGDVWRRWIGFAPGSQVASIVWAGASAVTIVVASGAPIWLSVPFFFAMWLGEKVKYMRYVREDGVDVWRASLCGLALLNPMLGPTYCLARRFKARLPNCGPLLDGWTAYAELVWGFFTALSYFAVAWGIS